MFKQQKRKCCVSCLFSFVVWTLDWQPMQQLHEEVIVEVMMMELPKEESLLSIQQHWVQLSQFGDQYHNVPVKLMYLKQMELLISQDFWIQMIVWGDWWPRKESVLSQQYTMPQQINWICRSVDMAWLAHHVKEILWWFCLCKKVSYMCVCVCVCVGGGEEMGLSREEEEINFDFECEWNSGLKSDDKDSSCFWLSTPFSFWRNGVSV